LILLFDTSTSHLAIGLATDDGVLLHEFHADALPEERGIHDARLAMETANLLEAAGIAPGEVTRIGLIIGPGSFTGARIAISYAKSLALGWKLPLCGISTFDAFEAGLQITGRPLLTAVRGRAGVVSVRLRTANGERRASGYIRDVLAELQPSLPKSFALTGNGAEDVLAALGERGSDVEILARAVGPAALAIAMLAAEREPARSLHEVRADYGELPAVTVSKS